MVQGNNPDDEFEQLTFESLYNYLLVEEKNPSLQRLPRSFYQDVSHYFETKLNQHKKSKSSQVAEFDSYSSQIRNIKKIIQTLYDRREKKIFHLALEKSRTSSQITDTSSLLPFEIELFSSLVTVLGNYRGRMTGSVFDFDREQLFNRDGLSSDQVYTAAPSDDAPLKRAKKKSTGLKTYIAVNDIPEFMAPDMEMMGPYEKSQELQLADDVAKILLGNGHIEPDEE